MSERSVARSRLRRLARGVLVMGIVGLAIDQIANYTVLADGWLLGRRIAPFDPPIFNREQQESLERLKELANGGAPSGVVRFDGEIGWVSPRNESAGGSWYDEFGARRTSQDEVTPEIAARPKLLLIGCSFTHGDEVAANETWGYHLQSQGQWNVYNCGVGGYGIDQAARVLTRVGRSLRPQYVLLGVLPKAIPRIYSMYRPAMRHHEPSVSFKPVLSWPPFGEPFENPARTPAEAVEILTTPGRFFEVVGIQDSYVAKDVFAYMPMGSSVLHRFAFSRLILTMMSSGMRAEFDPSARNSTPDSFRVPSREIGKMHLAAGEIGAKFSFVVLPDADDLRRFREGAPALPLLREFGQQNGTLLFEIEPLLIAAGVKAGPDAFAPGGHYSPRTNRIVADALGAALR